MTIDGYEDAAKQWNDNPIGPNNPDWVTFDLKPEGTTFTVRRVQKNGWQRMECDCGSASAWWHDDYWFEWTHTHPGEAVFLD